MIEFLVFILIAVNVYHAWVAIRRHQRMAKLRDELADNLAQIEEHLVENYINMKLEKHNGVYYFYDMKDDRFICQGKTKEEIYENFAKVHPDKNGLLFEGGELWKEVA
jgi:sensor domain CHASE-containing protein